MNTENHYQETDLGNISLNPRGEYNPEESYEYLDLVVLKGGSYVCLAENGATITGISPESGKTTQYWQVITIPGSLTPEYIAMHDRVVNLSEQVDADAEEVRTSLQEVSEIEINVSNLQEQTRQSAEAAEQSKDSSAGYAASADASRQAAEESKQNIDAQVTGFDNHVAEKTGEAENDIEAARIAANKAIIAQQEQSANEVARAGIEAISTAQSAAQTATEKAQAAATSEKNAAASETAAKLSEENATKMAEQVATDKEQVAYDRTAVENAKQEMTGSVTQIEQNTQGISELKSDLVGGKIKYLSYTTTQGSQLFKESSLVIASGETKLVKITDTNNIYPIHLVLYNSNGNAIDVTTDAPKEVKDILISPNMAYTITPSENVAKMSLYLSSSYTKTSTGILEIYVVGEIRKVENEITNLRNRIDFKDYFKKYLLIGDSLTEQLQRNLGGMINKNATINGQGKSGLSASEWWNGYSTEITENNYDCAFIYLGTNDGLTDTVDTDCNTDYTQNANTNTGCYGKIIGKIKETNPNCKIFLICGPNEYIRRSDMNSVTKKISTKYNVFVLDLENCRLSDNGSSTSYQRNVYRPMDGIHYNYLGIYTFINELFTAMNDLFSTTKNLTKLKLDLWC